MWRRRWWWCCCVHSPCSLQLLVKNKFQFRHIFPHRPGAMFIYVIMEYLANVVARNHRVRVRKQQFVRRYVVAVRSIPSSTQLRLLPWSSLYRCHSVSPFIRCRFSFSVHFHFHLMAPLSRAPRNAALTCQQSHTFCENVTRVWLAINRRRRQQSNAIIIFKQFFITIKWMGE